MRRNHSAPEYNGRAGVTDRAPTGYRNDTIFLATGGDDTIDSGLGDDTVDGGFRAMTRFALTDWQLIMTLSSAAKSGETTGDVIDSTAGNDDLTVTFSDERKGH